MEKVEANECKCFKCGKQADVFWPVIDPDIKAEPYCNGCVKLEKLKLTIALTEIENKDE